MPRGKFILGDCMEYLKKYQDNHFDLAIVDPPYGIGEDGRKNRGSSVKQKNGNILHVEKGYNDEIWDNEPPPQSYFDELFRVSKKQIIWGSNYIPFSQKYLSTGRIVWDKVNPNNDFSDCELAWTNLFSSVRQIEFMWNGFCQGKSLKEGRMQQGNKKLNEKRIQASQKPIKLYQWLLRLPQVKKGWKILDTHAGSASSLIACEIEGFEYEGFEILENHYYPAKARLQSYIEKYTPVGQVKYQNHDQMRLF